MEPRSPLWLYRPQIGCFLLLAVMLLMCLMPLFLLEAAQLALAKLHLSPPAAGLVLIGIFVGGLVNLPIYVLERDIEQPMPVDRIYTLMGWVPIVHRQPMRTIVAVNVGGCLIPLALAFFELTLILSTRPQAAAALAGVVLANVVACYWVARPMPGIGIAMPALASPAVSVLVTWLLLMPDENVLIRAPVAFVAGVAGPLLGADLLHLREVTKLAAPVISIGGAGTFDGIVLSGLLAAFLA